VSVAACHVKVSSAKADRRAEIRCAALQKSAWQQQRRKVLGRQVQVRKFNDINGAKVTTYSKNNFKLSKLGIILTEANILNSLLRHAVRSIAMSVSVCLFVCPLAYNISKTVCTNYTKFSVRYLLPVVVAQSSSDNNATICGPKSGGLL